MTTNIDEILKEFEHFGVNLGLERIQGLLADLGNPQTKVPIIHVAGTNGKGSVCAYLSAILTAAGYRVGRYISPHLVDWTERICLNEKPIAREEFISILEQIKATIKNRVSAAPCPTQFEVITAAAWLYFAQQQVDIAVMEVGLGGRLDATNVCDRPLVSIITSISWEHWQRLGPTIAHIAREKAGILKPGCPAICGPLPPDAQKVVESRIAELNCPAIFPQPARIIEHNSVNSPVNSPVNSSADNFLANQQQWAVYENIKYPLPLLGEIQLTNSALAIAAIELLQEQGWQISDSQIADGMAKTRWPGRLQWVNWSNGQGKKRTQRLLVDGAHNAAAAQVLRQYVDKISPQPVNWVMGMLSTKDHSGIFKALLRPGDRLYLVPVPDHSSAVAEDLAAIAQPICPELAEIKCYPELAIALENCQHRDLSTGEPLTILCGSLYLLGYFFATQINQIDN
jgi:dihydrofolate synthase/folylpolyglutamate synthase